MDSILLYAIDNDQLALGNRKDNNKKKEQQKAYLKMFNIRTNEQKQDIIKTKILFDTRQNKFLSLQHWTSNTVNKHKAMKEQVINSHTIKHASY
jgi:hypothetical protein